jgi:hypothetical protein
MNRFFGAAIVSTLLAASAHSALAADAITENRSVDARVVRVKLGGVIDLTVRQGATPSLVLTGDKRDLEKVTTVQDGDTLRIDMDSHFHFGRHEPLRAELTLPALQSMVSGGVGKTDMIGLGGERLELSVDGAGSLTINSHYKNIDARSGGVGSITINAADSESIDLNLHGAGGITVNGQSKRLHARLGGVGSLSAKQLQADAVVLDMTGIGSATVYAKSSAELNLSGLGSATVYGKPASRNSSAHGLGSVRWD